MCSGLQLTAVWIHENVVLLFQVDNLAALLVDQVLSHAGLTST